MQPNFDLFQKVKGTNKYDIYKILPLMVSTM